MWINIQRWLKKSWNLRKKSVFLFFHIFTHMSVFWSDASIGGGILFVSVIQNCYKWLLQKKYPMTVFSSGKVWLGLGTKTTCLRLGNNHCHDQNKLALTVGGRRESTRLRIQEFGQYSHIWSNSCPYVYLVVWLVESLGAVIQGLTHNIFGLQNCHFNAAERNFP